MKACSEPGRPVWLSRQNDPKRKLKYTWEIIRMPDSMVGVNTGVPNRLVKAGIMAGRVEELSGYETARPEVAIGNHTRLDLVLEGRGRRTCYIEIKNCTLVENGVALFPDAVTDRGRKHLEELARLKGEGGRAAIFFLIQRMDAGSFRPADHIDPEYGRVLREAVKSGVEAVAYDVDVTLDRIALRNSIPVEL
jgi:sugar fermentation stimulation protein A